MNNTTADNNSTATNETAGNTTADILSVVEETGLLEEPMVLALLASSRSFSCFRMLYEPSCKSRGNANLEQVP